MPIAVSALTLVPVKGMRATRPDRVRLEAPGPVGDRAFFVIDPDDRIVATTKTPALLAVEPDWDAERDVLTLRFPDGSVVADTPKSDAETTTLLHGDRPMRGRLVEGPLATAVSDYLHRPVRLLRRDPAGVGADDAPATLMSEGSVRALAPELGGRVIDGRRFRMTVTVTGVPAWTEHDWSGREVGVGEATLRVTAPVPRCVVTTRNPETGANDERMLHALAQLRGKDDLTLGVWCEVVRPGPVRLGDPVTPAA